MTSARDRCTRCRPVAQLQARLSSRSVSSTASSTSHGTPPVPAVVLSGGAAGLAVIRALAAIGVAVITVVESRYQPAYFTRRSTRTVLGPDPEAAAEEFVTLLLALAEQHPGALLVPTSDETVTAVARHKPELEKSYIVACMDEDVVQRFVDKSATAELASRLKIPAPLTFVADSDSDLERVRGELTFPCVVKPRQSHLFYRTFAKKMDKVGCFDELRTAWKAAADAGLGVIVQEFVPGPDSNGVNYNAYVWDGEVVVACTAQRLRSAPPQVGFPRVVVSRSIPEVVEPAARLLAGMGVHGFANVEFKKDARDGTYKLIEVNGRHNLSTELSVRCGVNFPAIQYDHLVHGRLRSPERFQTGVYWIGFPSDLTNGLRNRRLERYGLREQLRPYLRPHVFDVFRFDDPAPIAAAVLPPLKSLIRRLGGAHVPGRAMTPGPAQS